MRYLRCCCNFAPLLEILLAPQVNRTFTLNELCVVLHKQVCVFPHTLIRRAGRAFPPHVIAGNENTTSFVPNQPAPALHWKDASVGRRENREKTRTTADVCILRNPAAHLPSRSYDQRSRSRGSDAHDCRSPLPWGELSTPDTRTASFWRHHTDLRDLIFKLIGVIGLRDDSVRTSEEHVLSKLFFKGLKKDRALSEEWLW
jgi:hypothetical protein